MFQVKVRQARKAFAYQVSSSDLSLSLDNDMILQKISRNHRFETALLHFAHLSSISLPDQELMNL